jgi:HNH endonuclease/RuvC endonuclease subdomain 3
MKSSPSNKSSLQFAYDVGHSSIGWAVLSADPKGKPAILGCGTVIFAADDCLASQRRAFRRQRRHIRATRGRIARIELLLKHLGVMSDKQIADKHRQGGGHAAPWLLAARVLRGGKLLAWSELWDVLRWYAHNRGYDGNRKWSDNDVVSDKEDHEKVGNAMALYEKFGTSSMCETWCAICGLDPLGSKISCNLGGLERPKAMNAAFPREHVEREVHKILEAHVGKLKGCDEKFVATLFEDWRQAGCTDIRLPLRFQGGLLFGQLVPRFDNRIIASCPLTFEQAHQAALADGADPEAATAHAQKHSKVPTKSCPEFLSYRWAMQVANVRVAAGDGAVRPLDAEQRRQLDEAMRSAGFMTKGSFKSAVRSLTGGATDNLDQLLLHPDAEEALILDPVKKAITKAPWADLLATLAPPDQRKVLGRLKRQTPGTKKPLIIDDLVALGGQPARSIVEALVMQEAGAKDKGKKPKAPDVDLLKRTLNIRRLSGRAPFAREVMRKASEFIFATDRHPTEEGGPLYRTEAVRMAQLQRALDDQTNNHLVRHRLKILRRLHSHIVEAYAGGKADAIERVAIEVNRDLRNLSGKTAKQVAQDLGLRLSNFKSVSKKLEEDFEGHDVRITAGLIRKARIAEDVGWKCPYTGKSFDAFDLLHRRVDKDHIIPRSERQSDSLDSLVITFAEVNKMKGKRTALRFIEECGGQRVEGMPSLSIKTRAEYLADVKALESFRGHDDDVRRKRKRKELLELPAYVDKTFTPRDLTQTSQLVRLGAQMLESEFAHSKKKPVITSLPGSVTGTVRRSWGVLGCLAAANPDVLDPDDPDDNGHARVRPKTEIRKITHLHHALDACVLALADWFLPRDGGAWELLVKRRLSQAEQKRAKALFGPQVKISKDGQLELSDLPAFLKQQIAARLAEHRVVQHVPAEMSGLLVEQNPWRVLEVADGQATITQRMRQADGTRPKKIDTQKVGKLLGLAPDGDSAKLKANKSVLVIAGNFGVALDPEPQIIPFHKVWHRLQAIREANKGKPPRVLRNGMLIGLSAGPEDRRGLWRICSVKNSKRGVTLDLARPDQCGASWREVAVKRLQQDGAALIQSLLCGGTDF